MAYIEKVVVKDSAGDELDINASGEAKVNVADGSDVTAGATTDPAVDTDIAGTTSGKLRGLVKLMVNFLSRLPAALGAGGGLKIDGSGTALPVSGTVAVTGAGDATAANQTSGNQKTQITNGVIEVDVQTLATQVTSASKALIAHAALHGSSDGGTTFRDVIVKSDGSLLVTVLASALPTDAAKETKQDNQITQETAINAVLGIDSDAVVAAGAIGTISAKLRRTTQGLEDLKTNISLATSSNVIGKLAASSNVIGQVGIDQTTPGTTDSVTVKASEGIGSLTESAPGTDIASSGLNGRLQRIAQRLTSLIALLPAALVGGRLDVNVGARVATTATKTQGTSVLSLQSNAASTVLISSAVDVSTKLAADIFIHFGRRSATAAGAGVIIRIEASSKSSGNGHWYPLAIFTTAFAACEAEAVSGTVNAGQKVITVASTTNLTAGDIIYIDNGTIANSEWARIKSIVSNTSVTVEDDLTNAQTSSTIYDAAEMYACQLDLSSVGRLRIVIDGSVFTQACAIEVDMVTLDSLV